MRTSRVWRAGAGDADSKISGGEIKAIKDILTRLDYELGLIAEAVLRHPEVRKLEAAWAGLKFIIDRVDFREGVKMTVIHAKREDAVERCYEQVVSPAIDGERLTPGLLVYDYACGSTQQDIDFMAMVAQYANALPVPAVVPLDAEFFNLKSLRLIKNLPTLTSFIEGYEYAKWRSLRDERYSKALVPVTGRFILRAPHKAKAKATGYTYDEKVQKISDLLWGGGHLAMAVCAGRSYVENGWPTRMFGARAGKLEDLPVVDNPHDPDSPWGPGDLALPDRRVDEMPEIGINILQSVKNDDHCMLLGGVSAARPIVTQDTGKQDATLEISLPYQQFCNITSAWLFEQLPTFRGESEERIQEFLVFGLCSLLGLTKDDDPEAVQVGVGPHPEKPGTTLVAIRVTPPSHVAPGGLQMDFGLEI